MQSSVSAQDTATPISPLLMFRYTAMGRVSVFMRVAPATMRVAPNSPMVRAQAMITPERMLRPGQGQVDFQKDP